MSLPAHCSARTLLQRHCQRPVDAREGLQIPIVAYKNGAAVRLDEVARVITARGR